MMLQSSIDGLNQESARALPKLNNQSGPCVQCAIAFPRVHEKCTGGNHQDNCFLIVLSQEALSRCRWRVSPLKR